VALAVELYPEPAIMAARDSILELQKLVGKTLLGQQAMIERLISPASSDS